MKVEALLADVLDAGTTLRHEDGELAYRAVAGAISAPVKTMLADYKNDVLDLLAPGAMYAPASFAQQRLYFLHEFEHDKTVYTLPAFSLEVEGAFSLDVLQRTLDHLVERHEAFRTAFCMFDGRPFQRIFDGLRVDLHMVDLSEEADRDERVQEVTRRILAKPFDLSEAPLWRVCILKLSDTVHRILWPIHHIIADGMSLRLLAREFAQSFEAYADERDPELPGFPASYAEYTLWHRHFVDRSVRDKQLSYWTERLAGLAPTLALPTDRPRPPEMQFDGRRLPVTLSDDLKSRFIGLCRESGVSLFVGMTALYALFLHRCSGRHDFAIGTPVHGRAHPKAFHLVGLFVNTLVLRMKLNKNESFRSFLNDVQGVVSDATRHQDLPFERLVDALDTPRDFSVHPVFQHMIVHEPAPRRNFDNELRKWREAPVHHGKTKFDLTLFFRSGLKEGDVALSLEYNTALFDDDTAARFVDQFTRIVDDAVARPDLPLMELGAPPVERASVLIGQEKTFPGPSTIPEWFDAVAADNGRATAVRCGDHSLSYGDLHDRANAFARALRDRGIGAGTRVIVLLPRCTDLIAALLGAMKSGAAYVPVDPNTPVHRIERMAQQVKAACAVVNDATETIAKAAVLSPIRIDGLSDPNGQSAADYPAAEDEAYVLFTSGSTGTPKGVSISHGQLAHYVHAINDVLDLPAASHYALMSTIAADLGNTAIFPALCTGGAVHVVDEARTTNGRALAAYLRRYPVDFMKLTPSHLKALMSIEDPARILPKSCLVLAGETCPWELVHEVQRLAPRCRVRNSYGPTETTISATIHECCFGAGVVHGASVPIGRPLANARVYVLDEACQPVSMGLPGEVYIGGLCVSRGYVADEELTRERFLPDPFADAPNARMYRTGDRARVLTTGELEFLGRSDAQVKVRGFRVEPGEIEASLLAHPSVREAVVMPVRSNGHVVDLVAHVCSATSTGVSVDMLREFLESCLPDYMVPATIAVHDSMPLTANGKIDHAALNRVHLPIKPADGGLATETERGVAAVWSECLERDVIGPTENFLEIGGHSLLAIRATTRLSDRFNVDVPLRLMFEAPTIRALAERIDGLTNGHAVDEENIGTRSPLAVILREGDGERSPFFCISPAGGTAFPYYALAHHMAPGQTVYCLQDPAYGNGGAPLDSIEAMADAYIEAIRSVYPEGPVHVGGWSLGGTVAYEVARRLEERGEPVGVVALFETHAPSNAIRYRLRDTLDNLAFLYGFAISGLAAVVDGMYVASRRNGSNGDGVGSRLRHTWNQSTYNLFLRKAHIEQVVSENEALLSVRHPSNRLFVKIARANLAARKRYTPLAIGGEIALFMAEKQPRASVGPEQAFGWHTYLAPEQVRIHTVAGDHFSILRNPAVQPLAHELQRLIEAYSALPVHS